jgi:hypothetical protein
MFVKSNAGAASLHSCRPAGSTPDLIHRHQPAFSGSVDFPILEVIVH